MLLREMTVLVETLLQTRTFEYPFFNLLILGFIFNLTLYPPVILCQVDYWCVCIYIRNRRIQSAHTMMIFERNNMDDILFYLTKEYINNHNKVGNPFLQIIKLLENEHQINFDLQRELEAVFNTQIIKIDNFGDNIEFLERSVSLSTCTLLQTNTRENINFIMQILISPNDLKINLRFPHEFCDNNNNNINNKKYTYNYSIYKENAELALRHLHPTAWRIYDVQKNKIWVKPDFADSRTYMINKSNVNKQSSKYRLDLSLFNCTLSGDVAKSILSCNLCTDLERFLLRMFEFSNNRKSFNQAYLKFFYEDDKCLFRKMNPVSSRKRFKQTDLDKQCEFNFTFERNNNVQTDHIIIVPEHSGGILTLYISQFDTNSIPPISVSQSIQLCKIPILKTYNVKIATRKAVKIKGHRNIGRTGSENKTVKIVPSSKTNCKNYITASGLLGDNCTTYWLYHDKVVALKPSKKFYVYPYGKLFTGKTRKILIFTQAHKKGFPTHYKDYEDKTVVKSLESYINESNLGRDVFLNIDRFMNGCRIRKSTMHMAVYSVAICMSEALRHFPTIITNKQLIHLVKRKIYTPEKAMDDLPMARKGSWPNKKRTGFKNKRVSIVRKKETQIFNDYVKDYGSIRAAVESLIDL